MGGGRPDEREARKLHKAREGLLIDGVCAGVAEYLRVSPTAVRVVFVVLAFVGFWGALLYILGMVLIPRSPAEHPGGGPAVKRPHPRGGLSVLGFCLMVLGIVVFLNELGLFQWRVWRVWWTSFHAVWPVFLVVVGWVMVVRYEDRTTALPEGSGPDSSLVRPQEERLVSGVCASLSRRWRVDVSAVRVLWAFLTVLSWGVGALAYGVLILVVPDEVRAGAEEGTAASGIPEKIDPFTEGGGGKDEKPS